MKTKAEIMDAIAKLDNTLRNCKPHEVSMLKSVRENLISQIPTEPNPITGDKDALEFLQGIFGMKKD